ncbi:hypothetical protein [Sulfurivermis fontis]|jgi:hypothetical protein|uniref:hypothetical protein n=1 Tax=Sulfurivermis fontis TaxID=1972068 RepID=UPI000FD71979|nr:hypothetical protein [Sulfurivermis fontis]
MSKGLRVRRCADLSPYRGAIEAPHAFDEIYQVHWHYWLIVAAFGCWIGLALSAAERSGGLLPALIGVAAAFALLLPLLLVLVVVLWPLWLLPIAVLMELTWITAQIEYRWRLARHRRRQETRLNS